MKLENKKNLVVRTLGVGKERIIFNSERLNEIKEAITKQDIRDLVSSKAIIIREVKGRKTKVKRKRRRMGSIKKKVVDTKRVYMNVTRKLRRYLKTLKSKDQISLDNFYTLRKEIRARSIKNIDQIKERLQEMKA